MQFNMQHIGNFRTYQSCNQTQNQSLSRPLNQTNNQQSVELSQMYQEFKPAQDGVLVVKQCNNYAR